MDTARDRVLASLRTIGEQCRCAICLELFTDPVLLPCSHVFCRACSTEAVARETARGRCPTCRAEYRPRSLHQADQYARIVDTLLRIDPRTFALTEQPRRRDGVEELMQPFAAADLPLVPDSSLPPPAAARAAPAAARSTVHADHRPKAGAAPPVTEPGVATRSGFSQTRVRAQGGAPTPAAPPASSPLAATSAMPAPARRRGRRRPAADPGMATPAKLSACAAAPTTRKRARAERAAVVSPVPLPPPLAGEGKRRGVGGAGRDGPVSIVFSAAAALQQADRRRFCKAFGYRDAGDDDMEALDARTVLVMDASQRALREGGTALLATKRTLKYLLARARGMPIVASTWVSSSLCADALLPQEDFAVGGDAKCPPPAAPAVAAARAKPPLDGWSVAFCGRFGDGTPSVGKVLVPVAQGLGANVLRGTELRASVAAAAPHTAGSGPPPFALVHGDHVDMNREEQQLFRRGALACVSFDWLLDAASLQAAPPPGRYSEAASLEAGRKA